MANEIKMPQLSDTMNTGKILSWMKKEGDVIKRGDILAEVETEKANLEIESFQQGTLLKILVPANTVAGVGDVIAIVGQPGELVSAGGQAGTGAAKAAPIAAATNAPATQAVAAPTTAPSFSTPTNHPSSNGSDRVKASPLARKIAEERNIDLTAVQGSGPAGRIVKKDLDQATAAVNQLSVGNSSQSGPTRSAPAPQSARAEGSGFSGRLTPMSKMRETIARRMQETVAQSPHFYVTTSVDMGEAKRLYTILKEKPEYKGISLNHLVIKAVAYGIAQEPRVNRAVKENQIFEPDSINVGIITSLEDGLLIPVIREANTLPLKDIVFEARAAVERARAGRPSAADLSGGTFSISNMGMFDVENFTALINPGQGSVLAVSSAKEQVIVKNGQPAVGLLMKATISVDHRIIDGIMAATFLKHFKEALETPALLML